MSLQRRTADAAALPDAQSIAVTSIEHMHGGKTLPIKQSFPGEWVCDLLRALTNWVDAGRLCRETGLPYEQLQTKPTRVGCDLLFRTLERAAEVSGDRYLGLHLAEAVRPRSVVAYLARTQHTVEQVIQRLIRFQHLLWVGRSILVVERGTSRMLITFAPDPTNDCHYLTEFFLASLWLEAQRAINAPLRLEEVRFRHEAPGAPTEYERVFKCPVRFQQPEDALRFPAVGLGYRMREHHPEVAIIVEKLAREQAEFEAATSFRERVELVIRSTLLCGIGCRRDLVADSLAVSPRTLQRQLWVEGTNFNTVKEAVQRHLALQLAGLPALSADEITARCGFATVRALDVAFSRWTGRSLATYRELT